MVSSRFARDLIGLVSCSMFAGCSADVAANAPELPGSAIGTTEQAAIIGPGKKVGSCWGQCGLAVSTANGGQCSCNTGCELAGDCCADMPTYCPALGSSAVRVLVGPGSTTAGIWGTDLGLTYEHKGKLEMLFGDSWSASNSVCAMQPNDDSMGTLSITDRTSNLAVVRPNSTSNFTPITLTAGATALTLPWGRTPTAGFSDGTHAYALFIRIGDNVFDAPQAPYFGKPYVELGYRPSDAAPTVYSRLDVLGTTKFLNPAAATVASFDGTAATANYGKGNQTLFLFGRTAFVDNGDGAPLYLAYNSLAPGPTGTMVWAPQYYAGLVNGQPTWGTEAQAKPVENIGTDFDSANQQSVQYVKELGRWVMLYGGGLPDFLGATDNRHPRRGAIHMRLATNPWGPWSDPTPIAFPSDLGHQLACENPSPTAVATLSPYRDPGPWQFDTFTEQWDSELFKSSCSVGDPYRPNGVAAQCVAGSFTACLALASSGVSTCVQAPASSSFERGNMYGANVIPSWTLNQHGLNGYGNVATLYWNVSMWNPYHVVLASTQVSLPDPFVRYGHPYRLDSKVYGYLDAGSGTLTAATTNSGSTTTHFTFERVSGPDTEHVSVGDEVRIKSSAGQYIRWDSSNATLGNSTGTNAVWRIQNGGNTTGLLEVNDLGGYFYILTDDKAKRLKTDTATSIRVFSGEGDTARYHVSWGWQ